MRFYYRDYFFKSLRRLFYPKVCVICRLALIKHERQICAYCLRKLPKSRWLSPQDNPVFNVFRGRVPIGGSGSFLVFRSGGITRQLLHEIKYKDNRDLAIWMGEMYANELMNSSLPQIDFIIPVPLHRRKQKQRGYNQSEAFAEGLGFKLSVPVCTELLQRRAYTQTQTRKSRWERWQNVADVFVVNHPQNLKDKNVMLVDDVITTGATLEACVKALLDAGAQRVDVHTIAYAKE
ncbi:MAG: ComF family protein [Sphingomonadales bacterium]|nr:ComF family protein [Sphingomonadales bacterium]